MISLRQDIRHYFKQQPLPAMTFQFTSRYISGIRVLHKERVIKQSFITDLEKGMLLPSFSQRNIKDLDKIKQRLKSGLTKLGMNETKIGFLLPEMSQKTFIFSFESLPSVSQEREQLIRFRVKKQMPMIPDDARLVLKPFFTGKEYRVLASVARASIIKEYEDLFNQLGVTITNVGIPSLVLADLFDREKDRDIMVVNIEEDSLSLISILDSYIAFYRQKQILLDPSDGKSFRSDIKNIVQEIEKTVQFVEDKEKQSIKSIYIRSVGPYDDVELFSELAGSLELELKGIESIIAFKLPSSDKKVLSPLIGQCL
ncbi:MAG: hypothetical protein JW755_08170 [Candidatus Aminicenantes bacterium]|nr:hypothetical protein [Candidatus Aminicenantes bacterium]